MKPCTKTDRALRVARRYADGGRIPRAVAGVMRREPYPSEAVYFAVNPHVAGMASEDDRIVLNPFSPNSAAEQTAVATNEAARVHMRTNPALRPKFDLTEDQRRRFAQYGSDDDQRQTVAARMLSGDASAGIPSPSQVSFRNRLSQAMGLGYADGGDVDQRSTLRRALDTGMDYAGRGLALADLYSGGMLSSVAGLNPFGSYSKLMEARERALDAVPREAKAAATEPVNPLMAMAMIPAATKKGIRAFHGSPHDFDRFDLSKIGTGEGAQVYGRGLYFAENEGVAKAYRDALSRPDMASYTKSQDLQRLLSDSFDTVSGGAHRGGMRDALEVAQKSLNQQMADAAKAGDFDWYKRATDQMSEIQRMMGQSTNKPVGRMYEVNIRANPDDFLDWDKNLSQQSDQVRKVLAPLVEQGKSGVLAKSLEGDPDTGRILAAARFEGRKGQPEEILRDAGIPGVKYLDQGSRGSGQGTRNYVLFRDDIIDIVRKYGVAAAASMYGMDAVMQATSADTTAPQ